MHLGVLSQIKDGKSASCKRPLYQKNLQKVEAKSMGQGMYFRNATSITKV